MKSNEQLLIQPILSLNLLFRWDMQVSNLMGNILYQENIWTPEIQNSAWIRKRKSTNNRKCVETPRSFAEEGCEKFQKYWNILGYSEQEV